MAHSRGVKVYSYTVRNKKLGKRMLDWNIDAIGTDNPEWFL